MSEKQCDLPRLRAIEARLERATGEQDYELVRKISEALGVPCVLVSDGSGKFVNGTAWLTSIDAADALRRRVLPKSWRRSCSTLWDGQSCSAEVRTEAPGTSWGTAPIESLAILLATIRALIAREEGR